MRLMFTRKLFSHEGSEVLEQVSQRNCGCSMPGGVQDQAVWGPEKTGPVEIVPAHGRAAVTA